MNKKGSALIMAYVVVLILIALGAALAMKSVSESSQMKVAISSMRAFWVAEAGVQRGFWELNYGAGAGTYQGTETGSGDYDVSMNSPSQGNYTITSTASVPSRTAPANQKLARVVTVTVNQVYIPIFRYAAFGKQSLKIGVSGQTDSYDSNLGGYNVGGNKAHNGSVGTNGTAAGAITLGVSAKVDGNANTGPGGTIVLGTSASVTGTQSHTSNESYPQVAVPQVMQNLPFTSDINLAVSGTGNIPAGDYKYNSINLGISSTLTVSGNARIYLTNSGDALKIGVSAKLNLNPGASLTIYTQGKTTVDTSGSINNLSKKPTNFILYSSYTGSNGVNIGVSGGFYGAIYAPATDIKFNVSGDVYGSAIGKTVDDSVSANIHYDEALGRLASASVPSGLYTIKSWSER
jgi:hypothetical protein